MSSIGPKGLTRSPTSKNLSGLVKEANLIPITTEVFKKNIPTGRPPLSPKFVNRYNVLSPGIAIKEEDLISNPSSPENNEV